MLAPEPVPLPLVTAHANRLLSVLAGVAGDPIAFAELTGQLRRRGLVWVGPDDMQVYLYALGEHQQARPLEEYVRTHRKG